MAEVNTRKSSQSRGNGHFVGAKKTGCADDQATNRPSERLSDLLTLSYEPMLAWRLAG